jgi:CRP/FNR family transcriptional regulator, cyclic AMP receptor protein
MAVSNTLGEILLFSGLTEAELNVIAQRVRQRRYRENEIIFHRDDPGVALYIILSGKVKIHNETVEGGDVIHAVFSDWEFFGELSLLDGAERSADVSTIEATEVLVLTREDLLDCIKQHPQIGINILAVLARRIRNLNEAVKALSSLDVNGRLAMQLLSLARDHGIPEREGVKIAVRLTQTDMASLTGASRESINKALGRLRRRGFLTVDDNHHITLLKVDELAKLCA